MTEKKNVTEISVNDAQIVSAVKEKVKRQTNFTAQNLKAFSTNVSKIADSTLLDKEEIETLKQLTKKVRENFMKTLLNF